MTDRFWMRFFAFAGIFNLLIGLPLLIDPGLLGKSSIFPLPSGDWFWLRIAGACIVAFAVGYLMVASDLDRNRGLVQIGAIGKALVFLIAFIYVIKGTIGTWTFVAAIVDLIFVIGFLRFLSLYSARG